MVLKWPFVGDTAEEIPYIHCSGLLGASMSQDDSFPQKIVFKKIFISDTGKGSLCSDPP